MADLNVREFRGAHVVAVLLKKLGGEVVVTMTELSEIDDAGTTVESWYESGTQDLHLRLIEKEKSDPEKG